MANIKSQMKRNRTNEKARARNRAVRSELSTRVKAAVEAVGTENEEAATKAAISNIDKAAAKGVLHKRTAARRKSRLVAHLRSLSEA